MKHKPERCRRAGEKVLDRHYSYTTQGLYLCINHQAITHPELFFAFSWGLGAGSVVFSGCGAAVICGPSPSPCLPTSIAFSRSSREHLRSSSPASISSTTASVPFKSFSGKAFRIFARAKLARRSSASA